MSKEKDAYNLSGTAWWADYDASGNVVAMTATEPLQATQGHRIIPSWLVATWDSLDGNKVLLAPRIERSQLIHWLASHGWQPQTSVPLWLHPTETYVDGTPLSVNMSTYHHAPIRGYLEYWQNIQFLAEVHDIPAWRILFDILDATKSIGDA